MQKKGRPKGTLQYDDCIPYMLNAMDSWGTVQEILNRYNEIVPKDYFQIGSWETMKRYIDMLITKDKVEVHRIGRIYIYRKK